MVCGMVTSHLSLAVLWEPGGGMTCVMSHPALFDHIPHACHPHAPAKLDQGSIVNIQYKHEGNLKQTRHTLAHIGT